jgi:phytoene desaturase
VFRPARRCATETLRDPRLHRLFSLQAMYAGLTPDSALALYAVITYMDTIDGVWFPEGGIHAVPMMVGQVAEKAT